MLIYINNWINKNYKTWGIIPMQKEHNDNKQLNNMLSWIAFAGTIPFFIIFIIYKLNPNLYLTNIIPDSIINIPSVISSYNPIMTKLMDIYGKSAPLLAIITFILQFRHRKLEKGINREKLITACILIPFIYVFYAYFFLWNNFELTTSGRTVRWMSENDFTLLFFFICMYYCSFFMTYILCYVPVAVYKIWKER
ncbi:colicin immunity protein Cui [Escherichia coli]|uniref:colicin immunity protein Cui n=3 Tax=Escherichia coli TaxID=562 RepID=UPI0032421ED1